MLCDSHPSIPEGGDSHRSIRTTSAIAFLKVQTLQVELLFFQNAVTQALLFAFWVSPSEQCFRSLLDGGGALSLLRSSFTWIESKHKDCFE